MYITREIFCFSVRHFTSFHAKLNKYAAREGRMLQRLMKGSLKKKKNWCMTEKQSGFLPTPEKSSFQQGNRVTKRMTVLNKLFMKNITDLMATGEVGGDIVGHGISISKVKVSPDYNIVNIYWLSKGTDDDATVQKILSEAAFSLRHELSQLHVMGVVPKLEFVQDKHSAIITEVDCLLSKADYGEDFEPHDPAKMLKSEFTLSGSLPPGIQTQLDEFTTDDEIPLPAMRMDVLGLDHAEIMNKIYKSVKKSEAAHRRLSDVSVQEPSLHNKDPTNVISQKSDITKFIHKQKILKEKRRRLDHKYQHDKELLVLQSYDDTVFDDYSSKDEEDYIDDLDDTQRT